MNKFLRGTNPVKVYLCAEAAADEQAGRDGEAGGEGGRQRQEGQHGRQENRKH